MPRKPPKAQDNDEPMHPLKAEILDRVASRLKVIGMDPATASQAAGGGPDLIRDWFRKPKVMPRVDSLRDIAPILKTTPEWLAFGNGNEDIGMPVIRPTGIPLVSWVAASSFVEMGTPPHVADAPMVFATDLPAGQFIALQVRGDSMDRVAPDGSLIIVNLRDRELTHRRLYVFREAGEVTFKRWMTKPDRLEPWSSNPVHEPIAPTPTTRTIGRVIRIVQDT